MRGQGRKTEPIDTAPSTEDGILDWLDRKLTFLDLILRGWSRRNACRHPQVGWDWDAFQLVIKDRPDIRKEVEAMEALRLGPIKENIFEKAKSDAQLGIKVLSIEEPDEWSGKQRIDVTTNDESLLGSDEERAARIAALLNGARARRDGQAPSGG